MKLNLEASFAVADVRPVSAPDLWGKGWTFHIARIGCDDYVAHQRERWKKSGIQKQFSKATIAQGLTQDESLRKEILLRAAESGEINIDTLIDNEGVARHLIRNIEGLKDDHGNPVAYDWKTHGIGLLEATDPVPVEKVAAENGTPAVIEWVPIGQLIREFVLEAANDGEKYRAHFVEAAGKN